MNTTKILMILGTVSRLAIIGLVIKAAGFWGIPLILMAMVGRVIQIMSPNFPAKRAKLLHQWEEVKKVWRES